MHKGLDVDLSDDATAGDVDAINVGGNANLATAGTGTIGLWASQKVTLASGSSLTTGDGNLVVAANQQATATSGAFVGLMIDNASITTTGGNIDLRGPGGDTGRWQLRSRRPCGNRTGRRRGHRHGCRQRRDQQWRLELWRRRLR